MLSVPPVSWNGAEQLTVAGLDVPAAAVKTTVVAETMVTSSLAAGLPSGFQFAASDQFPVPAPPSQATGAGLVRSSRRLQYRLALQYRRVRMRLTMELSLERANSVAV